MSVTYIEKHGHYHIVRITTRDSRFYQVAGTSWTFQRLANARRRAKALARQQGA